MDAVNGLLQFAYHGNGTCQRCDTKGGDRQCNLVIVAIVLCGWSVHQASTKEQCYGRAGWASLIDRVSCGLKETFGGGRTPRGQLRMS